jgi:adenylate kinase family enzyme
MPARISEGEEAMTLRLVTRHLVCVTGLPLSGKSTIARDLRAQCPDPCDLFSTGDIVRDLIAAETEKADELRAETTKLDLFPLEDKLREEIKKRVEESNACNIIIDGFPRFGGQVNWLIDTFFYLDPMVVLVNAMDPRTLWLRARQRGRDENDTDEGKFQARLATASRNLETVGEALRLRPLVRIHTIVNASKQDDSRIIKP